METALEVFNAEIVEPSEQIVDPRDRLLALYEGFLAHVERRVFPGGCFFASVNSEFDTRPGPVKDRISLFYEDWGAKIEGLIRDAQAAGTLPAREDPAQLVFELNAYALMGNTGFVQYDDSAYLEQARRSIRRRLNVR